jgi:hypothetical protein
MKTESAFTALVKESKLSQTMEDDNESVAHDSISKASSSKCLDYSVEKLLQSSTSKSQVSSSKDEATSTASTSSVMKEFPLEIIARHLMSFHHQNQSNSSSMTSSSLSHRLNSHLLSIPETMCEFP